MLFQSTSSSRKPWPGHNRRVPTVPCPPVPRVGRAKYARGELCSPPQQGGPHHPQTGQWGPSESRRSPPATGGQRAVGSAWGKGHRCPKGICPLGPHQHLRHAPAERQLARARGSFRPVPGFWEVPGGPGRGHGRAGWTRVPGSPPRCPWMSVACDPPRRSGPAAGGRTPARPPVQPPAAASWSWSAVAAPPGGPSPAPGGPAGGCGLLRPCPTPDPAPPSSLTPHQLGLLLLFFQVHSQLLDLGLQELHLTVRAPGRRGALSGPHLCVSSPGGNEEGPRGRVGSWARAGQALTGLGRLPHAPTCSGLGPGQVDSIPTFLGFGWGTRAR